MKLKKITLSGFKSFAEKVSLDFDCEIMAIVGPNGCGKSNIVDAFRWVLGEPQAKSFRAGVMQDVLFAGSDNRKPANFAEVTLHLCGINGEIPFPYDEAAITRKLYRDGESEYLINKQNVRLKDIQDMFLGSGLGKNAFSIFEQGKLDSIIHLHPLQRRLIFDEAAGTSRFLQRKKETLKRLETATENYTRVKDIHTEVEKKTKTLKRQAQAAAQYHETREALKVLEKKVLIEKWRRSKEEIESFIAEEAALKTKLAEKKVLLKSAESEMEKVRQKALEEEARLSAFQKAHFEKKTLLEMGKKGFKEKKEQLSALEKKAKALIQEQESLALKQKQATDKAIDKKKNLSDVYEKMRVLEEEAAKKKEAVQKITEETAILREERGRISQRYMEVASQEKKLFSELQKKHYFRESIREKIEKLSEKEAEKKEKIKKLSQESHLKKEEVTKLKLEIDALKNEIEACEAKRGALENKIGHSGEEKNRLNSTLQTLLAREEALIRLKEQFEGFSSGAKRLLQEAQNKKSKLYQKIRPLFEHFFVQKPKSSSLFVYNETLVVDSFVDLTHTLAFAKEKKLANFSIFCLEALKNKDPHDHFFEGVCLSDDLLKAMQEGMGNRVSSDGGLYLSSHGVLFSLGDASTSFQREVEIKELGTEIGSLKEKLFGVEKQLELLTTEFKALDSTFKSISLQYRKKEMSLVQENFALQRSYGDIKKEEEELSLMAQEKALLLQNKEGSDLAPLEEALKEKQKEASLLMQADQEQEKTLKECESHLKSRAIEFDKIQKEVFATLSQKQKLESEIYLETSIEKQWRSDAARKEKEFQEVSKHMEEVRSYLSTSHFEEEKHELDLNEISQSQLAAKRVLDQLKDEGKISARQQTKMQEEAHQIEKSLYKIEIMQQEKQGKLTRILEELGKENLEIQDSLLAASPLEDSLETCEARIRELRLFLDKAEGINLAAIEEFQEENKRHEFLSHQLSDLDSAKKDLEEMVLKLDSECRKIFKKTYEKIRENFQKNFSLLFNGGEADLKFIGNSDILEAGIEIIARPPGKQMRSISLLSGGEKCLTAIALLFSIFEEKPAPFCILDEVDAPLDDANVERFNQMLRGYTGSTQFILVTHNKKTMAHADMLIGISMEEKGVSKLISLSFEKRFARSNL